jgi:EmrB/QacA subfamily drug resistance transporter
MLVVDDTVVNVALPTIQRAFDVEATSLLWVVNAYFIFFGGFLLLGGRCADLLGKRRMFMLGLCVFTVASVMAGLAVSPAMLVAARVLQGLGAAFVSPAALSLVTVLFEDERERAKALGLWGGVAALGSVVGVILSGIITNYLSWRSIFFINLPPALLAMAVVMRQVPPTPSERARGFDVVGSILVTLGAVTLIYFLLDVEHQGFQTQQGLVLGAAVLLMALLVWSERRSQHPLVPREVFRASTTVAANVIGLLLTTAFFGMFFLLTFYMQRVLAYSPLQAGFAYLGFSVGTILGVATASSLMPRLGMKVILAIGMSINVLGMLFLARLPVAGTYVADVLPRILLIGIGGSWTFVAVTVAAVAKVDTRIAGVASGLLNAGQQVGGALGLAILVTVSAHHARALAGEGTSLLAAEVYGHRMAFTVGAGFCMAAVVIALLFVENIKPEPKPRV